MFEMTEVRHTKTNIYVFTVNNISIVNRMFKIFTMSHSIIIII